MKSSQMEVAILMALASDVLPAQPVFEAIERDDPEWVHKLRLQQAQQKRERKALHMREVKK